MIRGENTLPNLREGAGLAPHVPWSFMTHSTDRETEAGSVETSRLWFCHMIRKWQQAESGFLTPGSEARQRQECEKDWGAEGSTDVEFGGCPWDHGESWVNRAHTYPGLGTNKGTYLSREIPNASTHPSYISPPSSSTSGT